MPAMTPEEICRPFKQYMAAGDIHALLSLYDPEVVFLTAWKPRDRNWRLLLWRGPYLNMISRL
jgi:hypothetical protein